MNNRNNIAGCRLVNKSIQKNPINCTYMSGVPHRVYCHYQSDKTTIMHYQMTGSLRFSEKVTQHLHWQTFLNRTNFYFGNGSSIIFSIINFSVITLTLYLNFSVILKLKIKLGKGLLDHTNDWIVISLSLSSHFTV